MPIIEKARKWMEKFTGMEPKKPKGPPTAYSTRKKQGTGMWGADIGNEKPREVNGKGDNSRARPL